MYIHKDVINTCYIYIYVEGFENNRNICEKLMCFYI